MYSRGFEDKDDKEEEEDAKDKETTDTDMSEENTPPPQSGRRISMQREKALKKTHHCGRERRTLLGIGGCVSRGSSSSGKGLGSQWEFCGAKRGDKGSILEAPLARYNNVTYFSHRTNLAPYCCPSVCRLGGEGGAEIYGTGVHPSKNEQDIDQQAIPVEPYD